MSDLIERLRWHQNPGSESDVTVLMAEAADTIEALTAERDALREKLRLFTGAAYPVATEINPRGYNWSEAYLDQALAEARKDVQT